MDSKIVDSKVYPLKELFLDKFDVDFYQREYVWQRKHIEDLITDLSGEFLKSWRPEDTLLMVSGYDPYYMGEIVLSLKSGQRSSIIDGQQRITTLTLLLIWLVRQYGGLPKFPDDVKSLIYSDYYGEQLFNLDIAERRECMLSLYENGSTSSKKATPRPSAHSWSATPISPIAGTTASTRRTWCASSIGSRSGWSFPRSGPTATSSPTSSSRP